MGQKFLPIRFLFVITTIIAFALCFDALWGRSLSSLCLGACTGAIVASLLILFEKVCSKINLRTVLITCIGLSIGYLLSQMILSTFAASWQNYNEEKIFVLLIQLCCAYLGLICVERAASQLELWVSSSSQNAATSSKDELFHSTAPRKEKLILADISALSDPRIIDLAASGILDERLLIARATINELYAQSENEEESLKIRSRRALDAIKKLEVMPSLVLQYTDFTPMQCADPQQYIINIARETHSSILTADISRLQQTCYENLRIINLNELSNSLKPLMQAGEIIPIKVQRYGKEPRQGVGYLEDGTMVVVNGGASYIGEMIQAHVLSVKHSSTGARMIFCNAIEDLMEAAPSMGANKTFSPLSQRPATSSSSFCTL